MSLFSNLIEAGGLIDSLALAATPIVYVAAIVFYIRSCFKLQDRTRFRECYRTMIAGLITELILVGIMALTWQSDVPGYVVPLSSRIASFLGLTLAISFFFMFMWLDLFRQYVKLRK